MIGYFCLANEALGFSWQDIFSLAQYVTLGQCSKTVSSVLFKTHIIDRDNVSVFTYIAPPQIFYRNSSNAVGVFPSMNIIGSIWILCKRF